MKLVTFKADGEAELGVLNEDKGVVIAIGRTDIGLPHDMMGLIAGGERALAAVRSAASHEAIAMKLRIEDVQLMAPIPNPPRNIFCVGKNYVEHAAEVQATAIGDADNPVPKYPIFFTKSFTTISGPGDSIPAYLDTTGSVDYEGELCVVIGEGGRGISREDAMNHVFGYTLMNDVTARRLQKRHNQWFLGKNLDGFCPMGPVLLTADAVPDVTALRLQTRVNGEVRQDASVADLIFDIPSLIETLSAGMTLVAGDIIATGTPAGVGVGFKPPKFLGDGDVVEIEVDGIGTLSNPVQGHA